MPRKSNDEMIAELEAKLAKARSTAVERVQTQIEKLEQKKAALTERREKLAVQIDEVNSEITAIKAEGNGAQLASVSADEV